MIGSSLSRNAVITQNSDTVAAPIAQQVASAMTANNQGVFINSNKVVELFALPDTFTFTFENSNENTDTALTCYIFNEDKYEVTPTANQAGTAVKTYSDGYTGKNYNALLSNGRGVKFSGFNIDFTDASGNSDSAAFGTANMAILGYNGSGESIPVPISLSKATRNTAQNTGLLTVVQDIWLNCTSQIKVTVPKGDTMVLTLMVAPDQK